MLPLSVDIEPLPPVSAVLFDLDGTLVRTEIDFPAMTAAMCSLAQSWGATRQDCDGRDILSLVELAATFGAKEGADPSAIRAAGYLTLQALEEQGCAHPQLLPGSVQLLDHLSDLKIRIGIVTRNSRTVARRMISAFRFPHDVLFSRDDVARAKPDPQHLWDALRQLEVQPALSIMVGDHAMDIQAGRAAGCAATVGVLNGAGPNPFRDIEPTRTVSDLREAIPLFRAAG